MITCKEALQALGSRKEVRMIDWVKEHLDDINEAKAKGATYEEIHLALKSTGEEIAQKISFNTLKTYVPRLNRKTKKAQTSVASLPTPKR